ncbi:josephin-1-like [Mytilus trossulus]|uniref:josephin-1-like n=1 Tax=Mytilus trossulus TaxID=6551 RepID=UPI003007C35D
MQTPDDMEPPKVDLYHEKQVKELCALHALNNLFQDKKAFSKKDLDEICLNLSPECFINPHRSLLGFGNYDVNVLMAAVQTKDCETIWFDKRKDIRCLSPHNIFGFILNTPSDYKWGFFHLPFKRKHWISFRKIGDAYYNLDSKLESPELIGDDNLLLDYLQSELHEGDKELLLVVSQDIANSGLWKHVYNNIENGQLNSVNNTEANDNGVSNGKENSTSKPVLQSIDDL